MRALLLAGTAVLALTTAGFAAENNATAPTNTPTLRANLTQMLQKSGYTDIRLAPTSFVIRAKDSDGNPVVMSISPDSFAELTNVNDATTSHTTTGKTANVNNGDGYVNVPQSDDLSSKVVGLDIYNADNKDIGTIKDIALDPSGRATAYIVSVGGFLGMGEHYVAVSPSAVKVTYNNGDKRWHAGMNANVDQLKSAPEFKYSGRWDASRT